MKNNLFKKFKHVAIEEGLNETGFMGYAWINLTVKQMNQMCDIADNQGFVADSDGWYSLACGIEFKRLGE